MFLPDISIKRKTAAWILMAAVFLFGLISFLRLGVGRYPDVDFPTATVSVDYANAAPDVMETGVADILEGAIVSIQGIRSIRTTCSRGRARISVEFDLGKDIDTAVQELQSKVLSVQRRLPRDVDPPTISKSNPDDSPILWLMLESGKLSRSELMLYIRDTLRDQFTRITGVGEITIGGYTEPNVRVWLDSAALSGYELTPNDIMNTVASESVETPAGTVTWKNREFSVRTLGETGSLQELRELRITRRGGQPNFAPLSLGQVATVEKGTEDIRAYARFRGNNAVGFGVLKQRGANEVAVADEVKRQLEGIRRSLPEGVSISIMNDNSRITRMEVNDMVFTITLSAILTALVCWIFLGAFSATMNVIVTIPFSLMGAFTAVYFLGFTLNTFTLMALSLVIGIVVDDAIMVIENIMRHREEGQGRVEGAGKGVNEVVFAALATTFSLVSIFLPVAFMSGIIGKFFYQFGVTLSIAVVFSTLGALTVTPMMASRFLKVSSRTTFFGRAFEAFVKKLLELYRVSLAFTLKHRLALLSGAGVVFAASFTVLAFLPKEFSPATDAGTFQLQVQASVGSSLDFTDVRMREVEKVLSERGEIDRYFAVAGGQAANQGWVNIVLKDKNARGKNPATGRNWTQAEVMKEYRELFSKIKGVRVSIRDTSSQSIPGVGGYPVEFAVQGPDWNTLVAQAAMLTNALTETGAYLDLSSDYREGAPELAVLPDRDAAAAYGVSVSTIASVINMMIGGVNIGTYSEQGHKYNILMKLKGAEADPERLIKGLYVRNSFGQLVPLSRVVTIKEQRSLSSIRRLNRQRAITVTANTAPGWSQEKALETASRTADKVLAKGYYISISGSAKTFNESFQSLLFTLLLGIAMAYMVISLQFDSFVDPFTVLMALPFSFSGAFVALLLAGQSLNIYSMIGLILLMGIVMKNSILLVDFTNRIRREENLDVISALVKACPLRLRPILMTSFTTLASAVPVALALGPGAENRIPMAVAIIGGLLFSTLLTLFVVPTVYSLLAGLGKNKAE